MLPGLTMTIHSRQLSVEYRNVYTSDTNTSSYTFNNCDFGTPRWDRYIHLAVGARKAAAGTINSITIGGVAATILNGTLNNQFVMRYQAYALVPNGATGTITLSHSASMDYRVTGAMTPPSSDVSVEGALGTAPVTANINRIAGGVVIGSVASENLNAFTWTNLDEVADLTVSNETRASSAMRRSSEPGNMTVSVVSTGTTYRALSLCQWV